MDKFAAQIFHMVKYTCETKAAEIVVVENYPVLALPSRYLSSGTDDIKRYTQFGGVFKFLT